MIWLVSRSVRKPYTCDSCGRDRPRGAACHYVIEDDATLIRLCILCIEEVKCAGQAFAEEVEEIRGMTGHEVSKILAGDDDVGKSAKNPPTCPDG